MFYTLMFISFLLLTPAKADDSVVVDYDALDGIDIDYDALNDLDESSSSLGKEAPIVLKAPNVKEIKEINNKKVNVKKNVSSAKKDSSKTSPKKKTSLPVKNKTAKTKPQENKKTETQKKPILTPIMSNEVIIGQVRERPKDAPKPTSIKIIREIKVSTISEKGEKSVVKDETVEEINLKDIAKKEEIEEIKIDENANAVNPKRLSLNFPVSATALTEDDANRLKSFFNNYNENDKVKIVSYATGVKGSQESAKRTSLKRALNVRTAIIKFGIKSNLIEVRSHGQSDNPDKTDIVEITIY